MKVFDIMNSRAVWVRPGTPAREAFGMLRKIRFRHLPVVDMQMNVVGVVSDSDLRIAVLLEMRPSDPTEYMLHGPLTVGRVMVSEPQTVEPDNDIRVALRRMQDGNFSSLPVVEEGKLVGIVSMVSMMRLLNEILAERV